jgi:hypothetical protein
MSFEKDRLRPPARHLPPPTGLSYPGVLPSYPWRRAFRAPVVLLVGRHDAAEAAGHVGEQLLNRWELDPEATPATLTVTGLDG